MFGGKCGYTGVQLDDKWTVDHVIPKCAEVWSYPKDKRAALGINYSCNDAENVIPALSVVNHYKANMSLDEFRNYMMQFHSKIQPINRKKMYKPSLKRMDDRAKLAEVFGITANKPFNGVFYFETIGK